MVFPANVNKIGWFLKEQLTKTLPRLYEINYAQLWGLDSNLNFHVALGDLPLGLDFLEAYYKSDAGQMAALYDGFSDDAPTVDVSLGKKTFPCAIFIQGARWNLMDIEKMRVASETRTMLPSINIITAKQDAVADYMNRREHHTVLYGYPKKGIYGIFSQRGIATADATFVPYTKTSGAYNISTAALYEDLTDIIWQFVNRAKLSTPAQVQMKVPPRLGRRLVEIYKTSAGESIGMTVQQMLRSTELGLGINSISIHNELQGSELNKYVWNEAGNAYYPTSNDRIVFKATTYNPERHFFARRPIEPFRRGSLEYEQVTISSTSGILNFEEEFMWYYDFSNALS
jgi:hypothetical protein